MKCEHCGQDLRVVSNIPKSEINSTDVYMVQTFVCVNNECALFAGNDLNNPLQVAKTREVKVN